MNPLKPVKRPQFSLPDQDGETINLSDFAGQRARLFYPKAMTPGCTTKLVAYVMKWMH